MKDSAYSLGGSGIPPAIVVFGGDGYIGWPLVLELALTHPDRSIVVADNYLTRRNAAKINSQSLIPIGTMPERIDAARSTFGLDNIFFRNLDCTDSDEVMALIADLQPEVVYHLAHQRAAPYSMLGLRECIETVTNNEVSFLNVIWALKDFAPDCHLVKLGSFGAYAKGGLDIPEGHRVMSCNGRTSAVAMPFPRASDDFYHITKINDGNFAGLACRKWGLRITDVMQSTVFGASTARTLCDPRLHTRFDYDKILGTVVNRFVTQAIAGVPLTVYGLGTQTSGIMVIDDCIRVLTNLASDPCSPGEHRIINNSPQSYSINTLADLVCQKAARLGITATIDRSYNPRFEEGIAYDYSVETTYLDRLLTPTPLRDAIASSLALLVDFADGIDTTAILPTHDWSGATMQRPAPFPAVDLGMEPERADVALVQ